jgi:hypothetical protein
MKRNSLIGWTLRPVLVSAPLLSCWVYLAAGCGSEESEPETTATDDAGSPSDQASGGGSADGGAASATGGSTGDATGGAPAAAGATGAAGGAAEVDAGFGFVTAQPELTCPEQADLASWLPSNPVDPCTKGCGPDKIGWKSCHRTENPDDCAVPPCAVCDLCQYDDPIHPCYATPGDPSLPLPPECPEGTLKSADCEPACDGTTVGLCTHENPSDTTKIEGCVCAERGEWACATYNLETNTWN